MVYIASGPCTGAGGRYIVIHGWVSEAGTQLRNIGIVLEIGGRVQVWAGVWGAES